MGINDVRRKEGQVFIRVQLINEQSFSSVHVPNTNGTGLPDGSSYIYNYNSVISPTSTPEDCL
jgi:hypothetical protein